MAGSQRSRGQVSPELAAVGEQLRAAREAAHRSLADMEAVTRIRAVYLAAIEAGLGSELPGDVFVKGFVRAYANDLGLDGDGLVTQYKKRALEREASPMEAPVPFPMTPLRHATARRWQERLADAVLDRHWGRWLLAAAVVAAAGWGAYVLAGSFASGLPVAGRGVPPQLAAATTRRGGGTKVAALGGSARVAGSAANLVAIARPSVQVRFVHLANGWHGSYVVAHAPAAGLLVRIATNQRCWTDRWIDGSTRARPVTLLGSGSTVWRARRSMRVEVANAPGVRIITVDGRKTARLPREGSHAEWLSFRVSAVA